MNTIGLVRLDPWLKPFEGIITQRHRRFINTSESLTGAGTQSLTDFASGHLYFGLHRTSKGWVFREWAPNATDIYLVGNFSDWTNQEAYRLHRIDNGQWVIELPTDTLKHGDLYKLHMVWPNGSGDRIPSYANRVVQDPHTHIFSAQVWQPDTRFTWTDESFRTRTDNPLIYEAHIGMSGEKGDVSTYNEFRINVLPRIVKGGYNTIQLMAIQEHPYYGSFGYHVSNFFAATSRFGTPEDLKALVNEAHNLGINVIMDLVHSHAVKNEIEGLSKFDGSYSQYFYDDDRGFHPAWDSRCFNYGKGEVQHFLLSNCRYWLEEYHFDGFRFDGVTSMLYHNHGLEVNFTSYNDYFKGEENEEAITYLTLANQLIHEINPQALSVAEEMSGYPGLCASVDDGGIGFDFRLSMGVPDLWIKMIKDQTDEDWKMGFLYHELTQHRAEERTINYAESHDQALVGDKTIIFRLIDKEMYTHMSKTTPNLVVDRGIALHKMIRLVTMATNSGGYLNFMGNEFGHPEWIDFPREGNNWSYHYARRQWSLVDNEALKYHFLGDFDRDMVHLMRKAMDNGLPGCFPVLMNDDDKVMVFSRGDLVFVFNFHPSASRTGYGIPVAPGKYRILLDSDRDIYGGFNRVDDNLVFFSQPVSKMASHHQILMYLPNRTAMVLEKLPTPKVY
ncbi:MAG: alpha amylase C-terminal domain-containing protein [Marinilabiliaceae bacterium]|nr:alpha amylase C-terminal domain-containing protein [Marinilabiliaceae bacterium]